MGHASVAGDYTISSVADMDSLAQRVAAALQAGDTLLLFGPLGSGKTTFVQRVARALGVAETVTSPTFTIATEYKLTGTRTLDALVHLDLYRLPEGSAARDPAVVHALTEPAGARSVTLIEWADRLGPALPTGAWRIIFAHGATATTRLVTINDD